MSSEFSKAANAKVILIGGDEDAIRRNAFKEILAVCETGKEDFDFESLGADEQLPPNWLSSVSTVPFMSERRTTVVRHLLRCDPDNAPDLNTIPESGRLILVADDEPGDEDKKRRLERWLDKWVKLVKANGGYVYLALVDSKGFYDSVLQAAKKLEKSMDRKAIEALQEMVGGSLSRGLQELEKLCFFVGDQPSITVHDVRQVVAPSREWSIWNLLSACFDGASSKALRELTILLDNGENPNEAANRTIIPMMTRQIRLVLQARICLDNGQRPPDVSAAVAELLPSKSLLREKPYTIRNAVQQAERLRTETAKAALRDIADADAKLKGLLPAGDVREVLEILVLQIASASSLSANRKS